VLNYIGGDAWKNPGQWIEWELNAPEDGRYRITVKARQTYQRGGVSYRSLSVDGAVPFREMESIGFPYSSDWRDYTLAGPDGKPYLFYLFKGTHRLRLEVTLGEMGQAMNDLQESIYRLNKIYRTILVLTGSNPDQFRDYGIEAAYPNEIKAMALESKRLYRAIDEIVRLTGSVSDKTAAAETLALQLERFTRQPDKITKSFQNFKDNVTSLGSSLLSLSESKLDVDYIALSEEGRRPPRLGFNPFANLRHQALSFFSSFSGNYDSLGNVYKGSSRPTVTVWLLSGRDQGNVMKDMIDDTFTPAMGINVNVKLVDGSALLNAVVAGKGPDVVLPAGTSLPVDYAIRGAVEDLSQFPDCASVLKPFKESAYASYKYRGGIYALPETESFNLLFYRKDILEQLGLSVPNTWDELIGILATLQGNNLSVGIPYSTTQMPNPSAFYSMVYQNGGTLYNAEGTKTRLDGEASIKAFKTYTSLFNSYGLPVFYDFVSRFRSGEMPIGVADYSTYNTLAVSAPEIRGLWDFTLLPGVEKTDSSGKTFIDRMGIASGSCSIMLKQSDPKRKAAAWAFMRWWASAETQVRFGREIESVLGTSARYATANLDALRQLSWSSAQLRVLEGALDESVGLPEVPGGYYTPRHVTNAINKIVNDKDDPRETLIDYSRTINEELTKKRQEFGLSTE
jgi:ABC-type glycerol-3-phosphate transport system substrate-binding protein